MLVLLRRRGLAASGQGAPAKIRKQQQQEQQEQLQQQAATKAAPSQQHQQQQQERNQRRFRLGIGGAPAIGHDSVATHHTRGRNRISTDDFRSQTAFS